VRGWPSGSACSGPARLRHLAQTLSAIGASLSHRSHAYNVAALDQTGWRIRGPGGAAALLGLKPTTLESRIKKLGLERPR